LDGTRFLLHDAIKSKISVAELDSKEATLDDSKSISNL
jgi:hypothetical protein